MKIGSTLDTFTKVTKNVVQFDFIHGQTAIYFLNKSN